MEEEQPLNPHKDQALRVGKAADRFMSGAGTVKAARIQSAAQSVDKSLPVRLQQIQQLLPLGTAFTDWVASAPWEDAKEFYRPPPVKDHIDSFAITIDGHRYVYGDYHYHKHDAFHTHSTITDIDRTKKPRDPYQHRRYPREYREVYTREVNPDSVWALPLNFSSFDWPIDTPTYENSNQGTFSSDFRSFL